MDAEQGGARSPIPENPGVISAYRFLALLILPRRSCWAWPGWRSFSVWTLSVRSRVPWKKSICPAILDSQRTVDNINVLRSEAAVVFMAEDPGQRRAAVAEREGRFRMDAQDFFTDGHGFLMVQDSLTGFAPLLANAAEIVQAGGNAETAAAFLGFP